MIGLEPHDGRHGRFVALAFSLYYARKPLEAEVARRAVQRRRACSELWKFTLMRGPTMPATFGTPCTQSSCDRPPITTRSPDRGLKPTRGAAWPGLDE